jgi:hypothetical protein
MVNNLVRATQLRQSASRLQGFPSSGTPNCSIPAISYSITRCHYCFTARQSLFPLTIVIILTSSPMSRARSLTCDSHRLMGTANARDSDRTRCRTTHFFKAYRGRLVNTRRLSEVFKPNVIQREWPIINILITNIRKF